MWKANSHPLVYGGTARFAGQNRGDSKIDDAMLSLYERMVEHFSPWECGPYHTFGNGRWREPTVLLQNIMFSSLLYRRPLS